MTPAPPRAGPAKLLDEQLDMIVGAACTRRRRPIAAAMSGQPLMLTGMLARLFGRSFTDILSGYRVFSRRFVKSFPVLSSGFEIETEISVHALELRMPVGEVETPISRGLEGSVSKLNTYRDGWRILRTIVTLYRIERPMLFFGSIGMALRRRDDPRDPARDHLCEDRAGPALARPPCSSPGSESVRCCAFSPA
jgi:hypothetical protein